MKFTILGFDVLPMLLPILIKAAKEVIDLFVKGEELNDEMRGVVRMGYAAAVEFRDNIVKDPDNTLTDEAIDEFKALCEDTAEEGGFSLVIGA